MEAIRRYTGVVYNSTFTGVAGLILWGHCVRHVVLQVQLQDSFGGMHYTGVGGVYVAGTRVSNHTGALLSAGSQFDVAIHRSSVEGVTWPDAAPIFGAHVLSAIGHGPDGSTPEHVPVTACFQEVEFTDVDLSTAPPNTHLVHMTGRGVVQLQCSFLNSALPPGGHVVAIDKSPGPTILLSGTFRNISGTSAPALAIG